MIARPLLVVCFLLAGCSGSAQDAKTALTSIDPVEDTGLATSDAVRGRRIDFRPAAGVAFEPQQAQASLPLSESPHQ